MKTKFLLIIAILTLLISCSKKEESESNDVECGCYEDYRGRFIDHWNQYIYALGEVTTIDPSDCQEKMEIAQYYLSFFPINQLQALEAYGCTPTEAENLSEHSLRYNSIINQDIIRYTECQ